MVSVRLRVLVFFTVILGCAIACAQENRLPSPPVPQSVVLPVTTASAPSAPDATRAAPAGAAFATLRDRVMDELLADDPTTSRDLGLHEYDGKVPAVSGPALAQRIERLKQAAEALAHTPRAGLTDDEELDRALLESQVAAALFWLVDVDVARKLPQFYEPLFSVNTYLDREYAPIEERAGRLLAHEEAALHEVAHVRENLSPPLSKPVAEVAARNFAGFATYLRGDVARVLGKVGDDAQRARFAKANAALAEAADGIASWLKKEAARGDQSHVLGPARYARLLEVQEGLTMPLGEFEAMNERDLAENKRAYEALERRAKKRPVAEASYFATADRMMQAARAFVVDHAIVDLASEDRATVRETPPYRRWNSASIDVSGPFEATKSAFYYLTLPDRSWPRKMREAYLGSLGDLLGTTIHEVYPGHFVQGRWQERAPTRVQKASGTYSFVEGWAHYCEQMMIDEGFGKEDPENELAMRRGALLRNCRFSASVGIHTKGMAVEEATARFMDVCHQDEGTAREQAVRGTFDPGYFAYTLGKLQIIALREEARKRLGDRFSLAKFHDALLSHGAPPVALLRDRVLRDLGAAP
ncbi:MAG: DUF885 domain-containing protein [Myxococcales bacterium]|nr:DUF885 domain-containing protein [Myxococcales bacterium]